MVRDVLIEDDGAVSVTIALTVAGCPLRHSFEEQVGKAVGAVEGVTSVRLGFDVMSPQEKAALVSRLQGGREGKERTISLSPKTRVIAVASGKGGVGKSTLTANLAYALSTLGEEVGVLDGDVYGHSIPHMLGVHQKPIAVDEMMLPPVRGDLKLMSIGFFLEENAPIMWRGPMLHKALEQFLSDVHWGDLDTLLVDMPPGTGDVAMSLGQLLPRAEALIVTTPQPAAQQVAVRAAQMAQKTGMRIVGAVENMSYLVGTGQELFGAGGGQALADEIGTTLARSDPVRSRTAGGGRRGHAGARGRARLRGRAGDPRAGEVGRGVTRGHDPQAAHRPLAVRDEGGSSHPPRGARAGRRRRRRARRALRGCGAARQDGPRLLAGRVARDVRVRPAGARPLACRGRGRVRALVRGRRARVSRPGGDRAGDAAESARALAARGRRTLLPERGSRLLGPPARRGRARRAPDRDLAQAAFPSARWSALDGNQPARDRRSFEQRTAAGGRRVHGGGDAR